MHSHKLAVWALGACAVIMAGVNMWCAGARSLIPLALDARVQAGEVRFEKHPGIDDVYLITAQSGDVLQVDKAVYHRLPPGSDVQKAAWSKTMLVNGRAENLWWSKDMKRLAMVMPLSLLVMAVMAWWAVRTPMSVHRPGCSAA